MDFITITRYSAKNAPERYRLHLHAYRTTVGRYACLGYVYFGENNRYSFDLLSFKSLNDVVLCGTMAVLTLRFIPTALYKILVELQETYGDE